MSRTQARGTSLIESMVVAGVISLIVMFCLSVVPSFKLSNRRAAMELQAGALAQSRLETLRAGPFDQVGTTTFPDAKDEDITFKIQVKESEPVSAGAPPVVISKKVRVTVTWEFGDLTHRTFRETVFFRLPR